jgi:disease resistance protein RPM1
MKEEMLITNQMASTLLAVKPRNEWYKAYESIGFGLRDDNEVGNIMRILSLSYYGLPMHLRTCLLYLCGFPENSVIKKEILIQKWIAEGFIRERQGIRLFEVGEGYFNDLINRSMIQAVIIEGTGLVYGCRIHDMLYDFICRSSREENFVCTGRGSNIYIK